MPWVSAVLPAPSGPESTTRSPGRSAAASRCPERPRGGDAVEQRCGTGTRRARGAGASGRKPSAVQRLERRRRRAPAGRRRRRSAAAADVVDPRASGAPRSSHHRPVVATSLTPRTSRAASARSSRSSRSGSPAGRSGSPRSGGRSAAPGSPRTSCSRPRTGPSAVGPRNHRVADSPSATTTRGREQLELALGPAPAVRPSRRGLGGRLPGGRHFSVLSTATLDRGQADLGEQLVEQLAAAADEGLRRSRPPARRAPRPPRSSRAPGGALPDHDGAAGRHQLRAGRAGAGRRGERGPVGRRRGRRADGEGGRVAASRRGRGVTRSGRPRGSPGATQPRAGAG